MARERKRVLYPGYLDVRFRNHEMAENECYRAPIGRTRVLTAYDPNTGNVLVHDQVNLFSYNFASNSYVRLSNNGTRIDYHLTGVVDPVRKKFVAIGNGEQWIYDISGRLLQQGRAPGK